MSGPSCCSPGGGGGGVAAVAVAAVGIVLIESVAAIIRELLTMITICVVSLSLTVTVVVVLTFIYKRGIRAPVRAGKQGHVYTITDQPAQPASHLPRPLRSLTAPLIIRHDRTPDAPPLARDAIRG